MLSCYAFICWMDMAILIEILFLHNFWLPYPRPSCSKSAGWFMFRKSHVLWKLKAVPMFHNACMFQICWSMFCKSHVQCVCLCMFCVCLCMCVGKWNLHFWVEQPSQGWSPYTALCYTYSLCTIYWAVYSSCVVCMYCRFSAQRLLLSVDCSRYTHTTFYASPSPSNTSSITFTLHQASPLCCVCLFWNLYNTQCVNLYFGS